MDNIVFSIHSSKNSVAGGVNVAGLSSGAGVSSVANVCSVAGVFMFLVIPVVISVLSVMLAILFLWYFVVFHFQLWDIFVFTLLQPLRLKYTSTQFSMLLLWYTYGQLQYNCSAQNMYLFTKNLKWK